MKTRLMFMMMVLALTVGMAHAQEAGSEDDSVPSKGWSFDFNFAPGATTNIDGAVQPFGLTPAKKLTYSVAGKYTPEGWGGEVRVLGLGTSGHLDSESPADSPSQVWGVGINPTKGLTSTTSFSTSPRSNQADTSMSLIRADALVHWTRGYEEARFSLFGGGTFVQVKQEHKVVVGQRLLVFAKLPNGTLDTKADAEQFTNQSLATSTYTGFGLMGGVEGKLCLAAGLVLEGRGSVAFLPWGSADLSGVFGAFKDIYLVNVIAGNKEGTTIPPQLAHVNLAADAIPQAGNVKTTVISPEIQGSLKRRFGGEVDENGHRSSHFDIGATILWTSFSNIPGAPEYLIKDPLALGTGTWSPRSSSVSAFALMLGVTYGF